MRKLWLCTLVAVIVYCSYAHETRRHHQSVKLEPYSENLSKLEREEIREGKKDASEAETASTGNDPDTAAHKFSLGAERLEAAKNDAEAEKTSSGDTRKEREHKLAQRLEDLAQNNRQDSAVEEGSIGQKQQEVEIEEENATNLREEGHHKKKKKKKAKEFEDSMIDMKETAPQEGSMIDIMKDAPPEEEEGWGEAVTNPEAQGPKEQLEQAGLNPEEEKKKAEKKKEDEEKEAKGGEKKEGEKKEGEKKEGEKKEGEKKEGEKKKGEEKKGEKEKKDSEESTDHH